MLAIVRCNVYKIERTSSAVNEDNLLDGQFQLFNFLNMFDPKGRFEFVYSHFQKVKRGLIKRTQLSL